MSIHRNVLQPSSQDTITLSLAIEERFKTLLGSYLQIHQTPLIPPKSLDRAMILWRTLAVRHRQGDYRNSVEEFKAMQEIAQWTVEENCILRNQPIKKIKWPDGK